MQAELEELVDAALPELDVAGCAVAFAHRDRMWERGFGLANMETGAAFTPATWIPIASMTKPYTATAVMALVEAGRIELDTPVRRRLPELRLRDEEASARVTVRQLLDHTAGWAGDLGFDHLDRGDGALAGQIAAMRDQAEQVLPVGEHWSYSNSAYMVAGRLVEAVCGTTFESAVERLVLEPAGLRDTAFFAERAIGHPVVVAHKDGEVIHAPWGCPRCIHPAGGLISTARDQLRWLRWWAGDETAGPLRPETRARMIGEQIPAGNATDSMGIGWMIDHLDGVDVVHHSGTLHGMQSHGLFVPGELALVVLANGRGGIRLGTRVRDHVLERLLGLRPRRYEPIAAPPERLSELAGSYRIAGDGRTIEVRPEDGGLRVLVPGDGDAPPDAYDTRLHAADEVVIRGGPLDGLRAEFLRDDQGAVMALRFGARVHRRAPVG